VTLKEEAKKPPCSQGYEGKFESRDPQGLKEEVKSQE